MRPNNISDIQEIVRTYNHLVPIGAGTKPALSAHSVGVESVEVSDLTGMLEYQPDEFTFSARAGTRLADVEIALAEHGQYLPFDPPLVEGGATLGGTLASGLSGSGRYRYGGISDFLLGVKFVDGQGQILRVGGRVVKNAAGFDLSKLMVGSLGAYGVLVEVTFKVFPRPAAYTTLRIGYPSMQGAMEALVLLTVSPLEIFALDILPEDNTAALLIRLGGTPDSFSTRVEKTQTVLGREEDELLEGGKESELWRSTCEFSWAPQEQFLVKVPLTPKRTLKLEERLVGHETTRRYCVGANVAWIAWPESLDTLHELLVDQGLSGLVIFGESESPRLGVRVGDAFGQSVKAALDPMGRWVEV